MLCIFTSEWVLYTLLLVEIILSTIFTSFPLTNGEKHKKHKKMLKIHEKGDLPVSRCNSKMLAGTQKLFHS